jgi:hypothetical protein
LPTICAGITEEAENEHWNIGNDDFQKNLHLAQDIFHRGPVSFESPVKRVIPPQREASDGAQKKFEENK